MVSSLCRECGSEYLYITALTKCQLSACGELCYISMQDSALIKTRRRQLQVVSPGAGSTPCDAAQHFGRRK
jgi:hypothetical protein